MAQGFEFFLVLRSGRFAPHLHRRRTNAGDPPALRICQDRDVADRENFRMPGHAEVLLHLNAPAAVERHTEFGSLEGYFDGYCIARDRLAALDVPADILMAEDDPVIPAADFRALELAPRTRLQMERWGGHCAFLCNARLDGYADGWVAARVRAALAG